MSGETASRIYESPHLRRAEGGGEAVRAFEALPGEARARILSAVETLAASSLSLAQTFAIRAPHAYEALGAEAFERWAGAGTALAGDRLGNREAAAAYFALEPRRLATARPDVVRRWIELAEEVQRTSRKLAVLHLQGSGPVLADLSDASRLEAWTSQGLRLAASGAWRGEFLASAYFGSGPRVLPVLEADDLEEWAALGAAVQVGREVRADFFAWLPAGFEALGAAERRRLFALCRDGARRAPRAAAALFSGLPAALRPLGAAAREALLRTVAAASAVDAEGAASLVVLLPAVVSALPAPARALLLGRVAEAAEKTPHGGVALLRSLPRALEEAGVEGFLRWVAHGEAVAGASPAAAAAYFALESRTSLRYLHADSAAVSLEEVQAVLRSYVRMLAGRPLDVRGADRRSLRALFDAEGASGESFALPERVDAFDSWETNFSVLKLAAANAAARLVHGTHDLSLSRVAERLPPALSHVLRDTVHGDGIGDLLGVVPPADPLLTLFAACEGARLDFRLRRAYRGLAAELRETAAAVARLRPAPLRSAESVLFLIGAGFRPLDLATEELPADLLEPLAAMLGSPESTVEDALAAAILLRERLGDSIAVSGFVPETVYDELFFERLTGETELDAAGAAEEPRERAGAKDVVDVDPESIEESEEEGGGSPLSAEEIRRLLESGAILRIGQSAGAPDSAGIFAQGLKIGSQGEAADGAAGVADDPRRGRGGSPERTGFDYDEWDHVIQDYRPRWCHLEEIALGGDAGEFFQDTLTRYADLLPEVRRQFQRIRPERYQKVRGLEDGEDFDLNAAVAARIDVRSRHTPSTRLYVARRTEERDVASLFLLDMSASTDEPVSPPAADGASAARAVRVGGGRPRRIIDVTKEALVIMAEALEELGDRYAIYGFSGQGRENVEFYRVKPFQEGLTARVRGRIGGIEPRRSTRMGAALRHALAKMSQVSSRSKHIFLLSDGFPQDFDYGSDRRSNAYGIQDTMMALQECQAAGVTPFCITVDKTGHDYLRQMCETSRYLVIEDVAELPTELPKVYERWVRA